MNLPSGGTFGGIDVVTEKQTFHFDDQESAWEFSSKLETEGVPHQCYVVELFHHQEIYDKLKQL
jgi:hypothetical protein